MNLLRIPSAKLVLFAVGAERLRQRERFVITRLAKLYKEMKEFRILASQTVIDLLLEEESQALELLQQAIERPILLEVESVYTQEQWDVIIA